jgi:hypothetical protein|tara:strand:- start:448 stop:2559 length:2112 start_codon:yes stop_codon:yes gene_type:complete
MKIHEYNEMMAYLLRPESRQQLVQGGAAGQPSIITNLKFQNKVKNLVNKGFSTVEIADELNSSPTNIRRVRALLNLQGKPGVEERLSFDDLNKDGEFEKFFKEYLEKESKIEVAGRTRGSSLWPIVQEALKTVPKNASLKEKYNAIKNFDKRDSEYGYSGNNKIGKRLGAAINASFRDAEKGLGQLNIKQLADAIPAYSYKTLQGIFGSAKKDPEKFKGKAKQNIINSKMFVNKLKDLGVKITQGDIEQRKVERLGSGKSYLFEPLTENVKEKLKQLKPLRTVQSDYDNLKFRRLVEAFSRASEDYKKFGFSKDAAVLKSAANSLNLAMIEEFTSKPLGDFTGKPNINILDKAMSKNDVLQLKQFIEDNPRIKNVLSITFDPSGKNGTYFKPRDLDKLSGGQLLKDVLVERDHIFPVKEVSVLEKPTKTKIGKLGPGGALAETPFNKVLTTGYFNNSLRNNIQNFLNSGAIKPNAIKQINNTLKGLDTTIYHNGNYYGGKITPSIEKQINRLGFDKFDIQEDVVKNIKEQDAAIKKLKNQKFSDSAIIKAVSKSKLSANPFFDPKNILTGLGDVARVLSTPTVAATFAGTKIKENLEKGESLLEAFADVEVGTNLLYPELAKRTVGQIAPRGTGILSTIGRVAANPFFRAARAFTPVGAGLTAIGLGKDAYERYQELEAMSPAEREELAKERDEFSFGEFSGA